MENLKEGDKVQVDARKLFMDDNKWVEAIFIRWERLYVPRIRNIAIVSIEKFSGSPLLERVEGGFKVSSQDMRNFTETM